MRVKSNSPKFRRQYSEGLYRMGAPPGSTLPTDAQAWEIIRAHEWGAIYMPLRLNGHLVGARASGFGRRHGVVRRWFVFDRRNWALLIVAERLSKGVYEILHHPHARKGQTRRLPWSVLKRLRDDGRRPLDGEAYRQLYTDGDADMCPWPRETRDG